MIIDSMKYLKNYGLDVSLMNNLSYFAVVRYLNGTSTVFPEYECCYLLPVWCVRAVYFFNQAIRCHVSVCWKIAEFRSLGFSSPITIDHRHMTCIFLKICIYHNTMINILIIRTIDINWIVSSNALFLFFGQQRTNLVL